MAEEPRARGLVIGVTGSPGSGKTSVARMFADLGGEVVALDELGHDLLCEAEVSEEIRSTFSSGVFRIMDGQVSRKKLGALVFSDPAELQKLNRILHPRMVRQVKARLAAWRRTASKDASPTFVIEGALLIEMGLAELCDRVVLVVAPRDARLGRLARARGWDEGELARRERAQMGEPARRARADVVIENASDTDSVRRRVEALWEEWR